MTTLPLLELRSVGKYYGQNRVLNGINLTVMPGEIVSLIGPSGSGKTTALRCMNFLETYDEGEVIIAAVPVVSPAQYEKLSAALRQARSFSE